MPTIEVDSSATPILGIEEVPSSEITGKEPVENVVFPKVTERGTASKIIDVAVDDNIYCMQDEYDLPYTTVDTNGNTVVSVVEKADPYFEENDPHHMRAKLHVKIFKNQVIQVEGTTLNGNENFREREFMKAITYSLEHNAWQDRYRKELYWKLTRSIDSIHPSTDSTASSAAISSLKYYALLKEEESITFNSATNSISLMKLFPTSYQGSATAYVDWNYNEHDEAYAHHLNYWQGRESSKHFVDAATRMKEILKSRIAPPIIVKRRELSRTKDIKEIRARQTLRRLIGEKDFQRFVVRGFITFKGNSGRVYQIFPGHQKVMVWQNGKRIEELCVVLTGDFPPTDSVIMRLLLIQESEDRFKGLANVFAPSYSPGTVRQLNEIVVQEELEKSLTLPEIFSKLKKDQRKSLMPLVA